MTCLLVGIDPGKSGGLAFCSKEGDLTCYKVNVMPLAGKDLDLATLTDLLKSEKPRKAIVERAQAMSKNGVKQGVSASFTFGVIYGKILGVLAALEIPTELVRPQTWKAQVLKGTQKDKNAAIEYCRRVYPFINLVPKGCRVPHDGLADALCILEYGQRTLNIS